MAENTLLDTIRGFIKPNLPAPAEESVRERAYTLWEEAGRPESDGVEFWLKAESELQTTQKA